MGTVGDLDIALRHWGQMRHPRQTLADPLAILDVINHLTGGFVSTAPPDIDSHREIGAVSGPAVASPGATDVVDNFAMFTTSSARRQSIRLFEVDP